MIVILILMIIKEKNLRVVMIYRQIEFFIWSEIYIYIFIVFWGFFFIQIDLFLNRFIVINIRILINKIEIDFKIFFIVKIIY